jgi:hypothetical protein
MLMTMPNPRIVIGTRNAQYELPPRGNANRPNPNAAIVGPTTRSHLAPKRSSKLPDQRDRAPMIIVNGRKAAPASAAEKPCTWISAKGRKKNAPPNAAYRRSVNKLTALNVRDRNNSSGNIGVGLRVSCQIKSARSSDPVSSAARTIGSFKPETGAAIRPKVRLPSEVNPRSAPRSQSSAVRVMD